MVSQKNIKQLQEINNKLKKAKSIVLTDYRGLTVNQINTLRQILKEKKGELRVFKNTLLKIGLKENKFPAVNQYLEGPTAIVLTYEDEIAPLKALYEFCQKNDLPKIKIGFLAKQLADEQKIIALAQLPSLEQLKMQVVCHLKSPLYGLVSGLKANLTKLIIILEKIKSLPTKGGE